MESKMSLMHMQYNNHTKHTHTHVHTHMHACTAHTHTYTHTYAHLTDTHALTYHPISPTYMYTTIDPSVHRSIHVCTRSEFPTGRVQLLIRTPWTLLPVSNDIVYHPYKLNNTLMPQAKTTLDLFSKQADTNSTHLALWPSSTYTNLYMTPA